MIRAFIAVAVDSRVVAKISAAVGPLTEKIPGVRCVVPENIHLTLKFLGAVDEAAVGPIGVALDAPLRLFQPFTINAKGLGVFPNPRRPRVLWVGLAGNRLLPLVSAIESALRPLGFAPENREFTPHLTIGRWRDNTPAPPALALELQTRKDLDFGESRVESVLLMQSLLRPDGAQYRPLVIVPLSGGHGPSTNRGTEGD